MVKLEFDMSKKMLPTDSIFTLQLELVAGREGIVTDCVPSLGVLASRTIGNVWPPSVESVIFTLAQLTGARVVLATAHVIVWELPPAHVTAVLGTVTAKGPDVLVTVTVISLKAVCPIFTPGTYGQLSLTVNLKFNVLLTELNASMF